MKYAWIEHYRDEYTVSRLCRVLAAVVAKKINPDIKALYDRLCAQGKTKMSALGACMRKLVHLCYGVLKSEHDYVPPEARST